MTSHANQHIELVNDIINVRLVSYLTSPPSPWRLWARRTNL